MERNGRSPRHHREQSPRPNVIMAKRPRIWIALVLNVASLAALTASMAMQIWSTARSDGTVYAELGPWRRCYRTSNMNFPCYTVFAATQVSPLLYAAQSCAIMTFIFGIGALVYSIACMNLKPSRKLTERATYLTLSNLFALVTSVALVVCYAIGDRSDVTFLLQNEGRNTFQYDVTDSFWLAGVVAILDLLSFIIVSVEFANRDTMRIVLLTM